MPRWFPMYIKVWEALLDTGLYLRRDLKGFVVYKTVAIFSKSQGVIFHKKDQNTLMSII